MKYIRFYLLKKLKKGRNMKTINHKELIKLGFSKAAAKNIIRNGKSIAVQRFKDSRNNNCDVLQLSKSPFENKRLDLAPLDIIEELLGFQIF